MPDRPISPDAYDPKLIVQSQRGPDRRDWALALFVVFLIAIAFLTYGKIQEYNQYENRSKTIAEQCKPFAEMAYKDIPAKCVLYWNQR